MKELMVNKYFLAMELLQDIYFCRAQIKVWLSQNPAILNKPLALLSILPVQSWEWPLCLFCKGAVHNFKLTSFSTTSLHHSYGGPHINVGNKLGYDEF